VHQASARVRVLVVAATTTAISIAAVAAALSTKSPESAALAVLSTLLDIDVGLPEAEAAPGPAVETADAAYVADRAGVPLFSRVEDMPPAGIIAGRELSEPHNPNEPLLVFTPRGAAPVAAEKVVHTYFTGPVSPQLKRAIALARLPQAKPAGHWSQQRVVPRQVPLLAYAHLPSQTEAPFSAVLGDLRSATSVTEDLSAEEPDDGLYRPHPRPDDTVLSSWLAGRSAGQFAPGQHPWVQNPLPASVYAAKQQKCLAEGIYFEARGEPEVGQAAVAQVILNRVRNPAYPDNICDVVYQNETQRHKCQFSFACDGRAEIIRSQRAWKIAKRIALDVTDGKTWIDEVGDSTHYHARYVSPRWGRRMIKVDRIGAHIFYRTKFGGWS